MWAIVASAGGIGVLAAWTFPLAIGFLAAWTFLLALGFLYFVPTIIAYIRKVPNIGSVVVINLFLGWTLLGWIVALAMAARSTP